MAIQYKKYITNTDKIQIFNYKINCIKEYLWILQSNVSFISMQHLKPSMP